MFILYIDGSGSVNNPNEKHFVLAGVAVFERQIFHLIKKMDELVESFGLGSSDQIEIHGNPMYGGRTQPWRLVERPKRLEMMHQTLGVLANAARTTRAFGIAVDKQAVSPNDPVEYAFEEICNRFNLFLNRRNRSPADKNENCQKGLIVMDESHYEQTLQALARDFRINGARWGAFRNLAEVPLFVDSRASRLVQLADLVAYAMWRKYEHSDGRLFDPITSKFDATGGVIHGLVHKIQAGERCYCPACLSRTNSDNPSASPHIKTID